MPEDRSGLLEQLAERVGCDMLSDLYLPQFRKRLIHEIKSITPEAYTSEQWQDALCYLLRAEPCVAIDRRLFW